MWAPPENVTEYAAEVELKQRISIGRICNRSFSVVLYTVVFYSVLLFLLLIFPANRSFLQRWWKVQGSNVRSTRPISCLLILFFPITSTSRRSCIQVLLSRKSVAEVLSTFVGGARWAANFVSRHLSFTRLSGDIWCSLIPRKSSFNSPRAHVVGARQHYGHRVGGHAEAQVRNLAGIHSFVKSQKLA